MINVKKSLSIVVVILLFLAALTLAACTQAQANMLEGIIQNIDSVNGTITVRTTDGKTHNIVIDSNTLLSSTGSDAIAIEALDEGMHVEIELEDSNDDLAQNVNASVSKVEGLVQQFQNNKLTVTPESGGNPVIVNITTETIFRQDDQPASAGMLQAGKKVEVKYDPQTMNAFKVYVGSEESTEIEGTVTSVSGNLITVQSEHRTLTLNITNLTVFKDGTRAQLILQSKVKVQFNPMNLNALEIDLKTDDSIDDSSDDNSSDSSSDDMNPEVSGIVTSNAGGIITITRSGNQTMQFNVNSTTQVEFENGTHSTLNDIRAGQTVEVKYTLTGNLAIKIKIKFPENSLSDDSNNDLMRTDFYGNVTQYAGGKLTVQSSGGQTIILNVLPSTIVEKEEDINGTLNDIAVGQTVEVEYISSSLAAVKITIKQP